jgi:tryptophan-rich sensory protein
MFIDYSWYSALIQPPLKPPAWLFAPVWTILYITMAVSLFLYARKYTIKNKAWGYVLFFTQLLVNLSWSPAFFGLKNIGLALALIILLDILVFFNIIEFFKVSKSAGRCLIPYFIWILFATYLNLGIFILN